MLKRGPRNCVQGALEVDTEPFSARPSGVAALFKAAVDLQLHMPFAREDGQELEVEVLAGLQGPAALLRIVAPTDLQDVLQDARKQSKRSQNQAPATMSRSE